jgi:hypothetical protein
MSSKNDDITPRALKKLQDTSSNAKPPVEILPHTAAFDTERFDQSRVGQTMRSETYSIGDTTSERMVAANGEDSYDGTDQGTIGKIRAVPFAEAIRETSPNPAAELPPHMKTVRDKEARQ